jgi:hypothetical protein
MKLSKGIIMKRVNGKDLEHCLLCMLGAIVPVQFMLLIRKLYIIYVSLKSMNVFEITRFPCVLLCLSHFSHLGMIGHIFGVEYKQTSRFQ